MAVHRPHPLAPEMSLAGRALDGPQQQLGCPPQLQQLPPWGGQWAGMMWCQAGSSSGSPVAPPSAPISLLTQAPRGGCEPNTLGPPANRNRPPSSKELTQFISAPGN